MKLIFIHGAGGWSGLWRKQLEYFTDAEAVTLPGHPAGELLGTAEAYTDWLQGYVADRHYQEILLIGHSLGGAIAMLYALKYPADLRGIVLAATGARLKINPIYLSELEEAVKGDIAGWVWRLKEHYSRLSPEERESLIHKFREIGPLAQLSDLLCCARFDITDRLQEIRVPTLVLGGEEDIMTPSPFADLLAARITGAKKEIIMGATHQLFLEKPDEFNRAITAFTTGLK